MEALREEVSCYDQVYHGDALEVLKTLPDECVDAICCDPPAGISFMGKQWDEHKGGRTLWIAWLSSIMTEALRVLKPGGHALVWALPRTSHWTACALEDAGFQIRDKMYHLQGAGFPKSLDVSKQIDKMLGAEREVVGRRVFANGSYGRATGGDFNGTPSKSIERTHITAPATDLAKKYAGFGTALKPSCEEWILCRKPLSEASVAANVLVHGTGALNIDASRVATDEIKPLDSIANPGAIWGQTKGGTLRHNGNGTSHTQGRWPAQLLLSHTLLCTDDACDDGCPVKIMDAQSGMRKHGGPVKFHSTGMFHDRKVSAKEGQYPYGDQGGASRYFQQFRPDDYPPFIYASKASRKDRSANGTVENTHPTAKSTQLMRYLVRLICPPDGIVLDCFAGSGSTGVAAISEGMHYILIEQSTEYIEIIHARIAHAKGTIF